MKKYLILIAAIGIAGISTSAFSSHTPTTFFNSDVKVVDHNFTVQDDEGWAAITVQSNGFPSVIKLFDIDQNQKYFVKLEADGSGLSIRDETQQKDRLYVKTSNGFIGIDDKTPSEQLDVNGNVRAQGDFITTTGVIKNPNGDICIGNGC